MGVRKMCDSQGLVQNQQKWPGVDPKFQERATSAPSAKRTVGGIFYVRISQEGGLLWQNIKRHQEMLVCQKMHFALTQNVSKIILSKKSV